MTTVYCVSLHFRPKSDSHMFMWMLKDDEYKFVKKYLHDNWRNYGEKQLELCNYCSAWDTMIVIENTTPYFLKKLSLSTFKDVLQELSEKIIPEEEERQHREFTLSERKSFIYGI